MSLTTLAPAPSPAAVNGGMTPCPTNLLLTRFGAPRTSIDDQCRQPTAKFWQKRMVTESVGPWRATGHRLLIRQLRAAFAELKVVNPELYNAVGNAGALCVRRVRGSKTAFSNHSFGLAIDLTINGVLDRRGDGMVQKGLVQLYSIFKKHGFFWGVEFRVEDAMHFEICGEMVMTAIRSGDF